MNAEPSIEITVSPHNTFPPSPISGPSAQTQEANRLSVIGQNPLPHPAPLGGPATTPNLVHPQIYRGMRALHRFAHCGPSDVSTDGHVPPLLQDTPEDVEEQSDTKTAGVVVRGAVQPASLSPELLVEGRGMKELLSRYEGIPIDEGAGTVSAAISDDGQYCIITPGGF
jgi:hypothetical protein